MNMGKTDIPGQPGLFKMSTSWKTKRGEGTQDQRRLMRIATCVQDLTWCCCLDLKCFLAVHVLNAWSRELLEAYGAFIWSDVVLGILSVWAYVLRGDCGLLDLTSLSFYSLDLKRWRFCSSMCSRPLKSHSNRVQDWKLQQQLTKGDFFLWKLIILSICYSYRRLAASSVIAGCAIFWVEGSFHHSPLEYFPDFLP